MARIRLRLFGTPRLTLDGEPVKLERRKAEALLAFLAVEPGEHRRPELAVLFWPEQSRSRGKAALRRALCSLTGVLGKDWIDIDRQSVTLGDAASFWCDVNAFERHQSFSAAHDHGASRACDDCVEALKEALHLYRGDFLSELALRDTSAFDEWQRVQAERLRALAAGALQGLVGFHAEKGEEERALALAQRWMLLDPLDERSHEASMRLLMDAGRRGAALRLYDAYAQRLEHELGIEPPASMLELHRFARARRLQASAVEVARGRLEPGVSSAIQARYYSKLLRDARLPAERDDVAAAWRWACERRAVELLDGALETLYAYADRNGFYREGIAWMELALSTVDEGPLLARFLARQAALYACTGRLVNARALLEVALQIAREQGDELEVAFCENRLGCVLFAVGSYALASRYLRASVRRYRDAESAAGLSWALNVLGHLSIGAGEARSILSECLDGARRAKDEQRFGSVLNSLGKDALARGDLPRARKDLTRSLELRRTRHHRIGIADSLTNLGNTFIGLGERDRARRAFEEAFDVAGAIRARPLVVEILLGMGHVHHAKGEVERAAELAAAARHLPGGWRDAKERARSWLTELSRELTPRAMASAVEAGKRFEDGSL